MGKRELGSKFNLPLVTASPGSRVEGDGWFRSDLHRAFFRNDSGDLEIHGHLTDFNTSAVVSATATKTTVCSVTLSSGYWRFVYRDVHTISTGSGAITTTLDFSGTAGAGLNFDVQNESTVAITGALGNTSAGSALLGSTTSPLVTRITGTIGVTVSGVFTVSHTPAASTRFTVPALGGYLDLKRFG